MSHLFISPHLDDAILSAGALIASLTRRGETVVIVTTMAGEPPLTQPSTPIMDAVRARWEQGRAQVPMRRREDAAAAYTLGAQVYHIPIYEAIFRTAKDGQGKRIALYATDTSPYGAIHPSDEAPIMLMEWQCPRSDVVAVYAPMGVDNHVDHRIAQGWAMAITKCGMSTPLWFYEEYPATIKDQTRVKAALQTHRANQPPLLLDHEMRPSEAGDVDAKCSALDCYQSHIKVLWSDMDAMRSAVRSFMWVAGGGNPAERLWKVHL